MAYATLDILYRSANVLLGVAALAVAGIVVVELTRRPARGREPLASALVVVFPCQAI
jgi:hypothetical protein